MKNRLARIAMEGSPLAPLRKHLTGPSGLVIVRRPVGAAKALPPFARTNPALKIRVNSVIDGDLLEPQGLRAVADLPSRKVLRTQIVGAIEGPLAQLVGVAKGARVRSRVHAGGAGQADGGRAAEQTGRRDARASGSLPPGFPSPVR